MNAPAGESFLQHDEVDYKIAVILFFLLFLASIHFSLHLIRCSHSVP